jgi:N-acetylglucosaminyl-diphospho-decaprenol L-rhamnosyltransferase
MEDTISIISVSYHTGPSLFQMIEAALRQRHLLELLLVDNGNPPEVLQRLQETAAKEPRLKILSGHGNIGFAAGCNLGARQAKGSYLMFVNPDCVPPPEMAEKLLEESKKHPGLHLIGPRVLEESGKEQSGSRRAMLTPWTAFVEAFGLHRLFPNHPYCARFKWHEQPVPKETIVVPAVSGALMFMRKEHYDALGGMDEGYFLHVDDLDLCLRVGRAGGEVLFMPTPAALHYGGTSDVPSMVVEWHKTKSFVRYFFKNFSDTYPKFFLWGVSGAVWARFCLRAVFRLLPFHKAQRSA